MTGRFVAFLLFFVTSSAFAQSEKALQLEIQFPIADFKKGPVYQKGIMGTDSFLGESSASLSGVVKVTNVSQAPLGSFRLELKTDSFLNFKNSPGLDFISTKKMFDVENLGPSETKSFFFHIKNPPFQKMKGSQEKSSLTVDVFSGEESAPFLSLDYPIVIKKSQPWLALGFALTVTLLSLLLLWRIVCHRNLEGPFQGAELMTLLFFTVLYVLGSVLGRFFQFTGIGDLPLQAFWAVYSWILILILVRLVPKPGSVAILMIMGSLVASLTTFGIDLLMLATYTLPGALLIELWFCVTGYGRSFFSSVGSAVCYSIFPIAFFWIVMAPAVYHSYYAPEYVLFWISVSLATYILGACFGFRLANVVEKRIH